MTARRAYVALAMAVLLPAGMAGGQTAPANTPTYDPRTAFSETDTNHDGAVDHAEFTERMTEVFYAADTDKDGGLSITEIQATLVETGSHGKADTNHDGKDTLHEFLRARAVDYEEADTNDDGLLQLDEVIKAYQKAPAQ